MNLWQILGLQCRHRYKSIPIGGHRTCTECGAVFEFTSYDIAPSERGRMDHYVTRDRSITRTGDHSLLQFKKRKEQR